MREILFKAKRKDNGEWVEGFYAEIGYGDDVKYYIIQNVSLQKDISYFEDIEIDPDTICQFTGLCDKNGNRVWENDIVLFPQYKYTEFGTVFEYCVGKMYWDKNTTSFDILYDREPALYSMLSNENLQVIGNIFDNADLLEVE